MNILSIFLITIGSAFILYMIFFLIGVLGISKNRAAQGLNIDKDKKR